MGLLLIIVLFVAFLLGIPICFSLGIVSLIGIVLVQDYPLAVMAQKMFSGIDSYTLIAVPLFIFAGDLMSKGGLSKKLVQFANVLVGHIHGGIAMVAIVACMLFAAVTGSAIAASAAIGGMLIPQMVKEGYGKSFSASLIATGGSIGPIIPPSIPLLIYGTLVNVSIAKCFIGGIIPGIIMGIALMIYSYFIGKRRGYRGSRTEVASIIEIISNAKSAALAILMPVIIIGGIMAGVFTPTEAGAIAVLFSFIVGKFIYRELKWSDIPKVLKTSGFTTGIIMFVVCNARLFMWFLTIQQIPQQLAQILVTTIHNKFVFLAFMNLILLFAGTFIDTISNIVIFVPLFLPIVQMFGIDLIHFGVIVAVNLTIGMCTPPLGVCIFTTASIAKIPVSDMFKDLFPQIFILIIVLAIITYIPSSVLFLANLAK
jgi:C4-dicarboxylate transporter DctM subunit